MPVREAELAPIEAPDRIKTLAESDKAYQRVEMHKWLFVHDWLPFIDGVYLLSMEAFESFPKNNRPTNLPDGTPGWPDGTPDWTDHDLQQEFAELSANRKWSGYFKGRGSLLNRMRLIGLNRADFMAWFNKDENEKLRETSNYPERLWSKYQASIKEPDADPEPADPADPTDPEPNSDPYPEDPKEPTEAEAEISQVEALTRDYDRHLSFPQLWSKRIRARGDECVARWLNVNLPEVIEEGDDTDNGMVVLRHLLLNPEDDIEPLLPDEVAPPTVGTALITLPKAKKRKSTGKGAPKGIKKSKAKSDTKKPIRKKK
jgi:hypothetical protein